MMMKQNQKLVQLTRSSSPPTDEDARGSQERWDACEDKYEYHVRISIICEDNYEHHHIFRVVQFVEEASKKMGSRIIVFILFIRHTATHPAGQTSPQPPP